MKGGRLTESASASSLVRQGEVKRCFYVHGCIIPDCVMILNTLFFGHYSVILSLHVFV